VGEPDWDWQVFCASQTESARTRVTQVAGASHQPGGLRKAPREQGQTKSGSPRERFHQLLQKRMPAPAPKATAPPKQMLAARALFEAEVLSDCRSEEKVAL